MATHIVAVRVLNKCQGVERDLGDKLDALRVRGMIDTPLKNATAVTMSCNFDTVGRDSVVDKLD
jgi:hypothetical protein